MAWPAFVPIILTAAYVVFVTAAYVKFSHLS